MRIAIVNPLASAVDTIRRVVGAVDGYSVAWTASSGTEAVSKCLSETPDLILMDLMLPARDGCETIRWIMRRTSCAILVVTPTVSGQAALVFEAMGCGALDAVTTPALGQDGKVEGGAELLKKIATIRRLIGTTRAGRDPAPRSTARGHGGALPPMVAVGASTGGPKAVATVLASLPADLGAAIVVVQHVDAHLAEGLADWLRQQSKLEVRVATENVRPASNVVLVAGTRDHLVFGEDEAFHYSPDPRDCAFRPSVDALFATLAANGPRRGVAVLLTGMGSDGARGLLALRQAGWNTIAQDKDTSVIYGMPRAAAELHAAAEILPLSRIAGRIVAFVQRGKPAP